MSTPRRYKTVAHMRDGKVLNVGYSNSPEGFTTALMMHPDCVEIRVFDIQSGVTDDLVCGWRKDKETKEWVMI